MKTVLRTLGFGSRFDQGKYKGQIVSTILVLDIEYVVWVYYHIQHISFIESVLDQMQIFDAIRIPKPGIDNEMWSRWYVNYLGQMTETERTKWLFRKRAKSRKKIIERAEKMQRKDRKFFSESNMAYQNQHGDLQFRESRQIPYYKHRLP